MKHTPPQTRAFTLLELLITIGILAVLAVLIFPSARGVLDRAKLAKCQNNLRQITAAGLAYVADNDGFFPSRPKGSDMRTESLTNPWYVGGKLNTADPNDRPLNAYTENNFKLFICPADEGRHMPKGGPAWAEKPFYETFGCSYYYNSYVGSQKSIKAGDQATGLFGKRMSYIKQPAKMVFFGDQDARAVGSNGSNWATLALRWHSSPTGPLMANMTFVDGSMRMVDVVKGYEDEEYIFYNE